MINNLTQAEQMEIIFKTLVQIASNFWPIIVIGAIGLTFLAFQENRKTK